MTITKVTFKHEDEIDGIAVGPVCVIDEENDTRTQLDPWRTKPEALALARRHGVTLTEA